MPNTYTGRIWVDVQFTAENVEEAKAVLSALTHDVGWEKFPVDAEIYDVQAEKVWRENGEMIHGK